jgi:hypothetical protein
MWRPLHSYTLGLVGSGERLSEAAKAPKHGMPKSSTFRSFVTMSYRERKVYSVAIAFVFAPYGQLPTSVQGFQHASLVHVKDDLKKQNIQD